MNRIIKALMLGVTLVVVMKIAMCLHRKVHKMIDID